MLLPEILHGAVDLLPLPFDVFAMIEEVGEGRVDLGKAQTVVRGNLLNAQAVLQVPGRDHRHRDPPTFELRLPPHLIGDLDVLDVRRC